MTEGIIIEDKSIHREETTTKGLRCAFLCRISDPSMLKKYRKTSVNDKSIEIAKSIEMQKKVMRGACNKLDITWNESLVIGDEKPQHSTRKFTKKFEDRGDFVTLECWIVNKQIDAVMCAYLDRTGRFSPVTGMMINLLRMHDIKFFEADHPHDLENPTQRLVLSIRADMAEMAANDMRTKSYLTVLDTAINEGKYRKGRVAIPYMKNPNGKEPFFVVDLKRHKMWKGVRSLYKENDGINKWSVGVLAKKFNCSTRTIQEILFSPKFHTGFREVHFQQDEPIGDYQKIDKTLHTQDYPIIADPEEYEELIRIRNGKRINKGSKKNRYQLRKRVKCGDCNSWMSGNEDHSGKLLMRCVNQDYKSRTKVPSHPLEEAVFREIAHLFDDPGELETSLGEKGVRYKTLQEQIAAFQRLWAGKDREQRNLVNAVAKADNDDEADLFINKRKQVLNEQNSLQKDIESMENELASLKDIEHINLRLPAIQKRINRANNFKDYTFEEKMKLLQHFFPPARPNERKHGVTVWKVKEGHYKFKIDCVLCDSFVSELYEKDGGWEIDGEWSDVSNFTLY